MDVALSVALAVGVIEYLPSLWVDVQLVNEDHQPWSDWIPEQAIIRVARQLTFRLSGQAIRNHFYFATPPGNRELVVASFRGGLFSLLQ